MRAASHHNVYVREAAAASVLPVVGRCYQQSAGAVDKASSCEGCSLGVSPVADGLRAREDAVTSDLMDHPASVIVTNIGVLPGKSFQLHRLQCDSASNYIYIYSNGLQ